MRFACALIMLVSVGAVDADTPVRVDEAGGLEAYAQLPEFDNVAISPDGKRILMLRPKDDHLQLIVMDLEAGSSRVVLRPRTDEYLFNWCRWKNEERIVCSVRMHTERTGVGGPLLEAVAIQRLTITRLFAVNADGSALLALVPEPSPREGRDIQLNSQLQDRVLSWLAHDREHVLLQLDREKPNRPSVYRLNVYTNRLERVHRSRSSVRFWYADHRGDVRLGVGFRGTTPMAVVRSGSRFLEADVSQFSTDVPPQPRAFSAEGNAYLEMFQGERRGIYEVRLDPFEVVRPLVTDDEFDIYGSIAVDELTGALIGASYWREERVIRWFDEPTWQSYERAKRALDEARLLPVSWDRSRARAIFRVDAAHAVAAYYFYDDAARRLMRIGATHPKIADDTVAPMQIVTYPSRDGARITAYYTAPLGIEPRNLPTVILPHGGPHVRDVPEFDAFVQLLASRGYAVLQPNFRGSIGYGLSFLRAGYGEWGRRMQDDVIDGLDWLIALGMADPRRVCVVGGSYGGYVALVAAFRTPERIRCAVSFAGITDLPALVQEMWKFDVGEVSQARVRAGLSGKALQEVSPLHNVERIDVPLLIVHGDRDRQVPIEQSRTLVERLREARKPHRYIEQPDGDHQLSLRRHRLEYYDAVADFLAEHLTPPS